MTIRLSLVIASFFGIFSVDKTLPSIKLKCIYSTVNIIISFLFYADLNLQLNLCQIFHEDPSSALNKKYIKKRRVAESEVHYRWRSQKT